MCPGEAVTAEKAEDKFVFSFATVIEEGEYLAQQVY